MAGVGKIKSNIKYGRTGPLGMDLAKVLAKKWCNSFE